MFNIDEFKAQGLVYGGARPTLFQVVVSPPPSLSLDLLSARKFELTARATSVPEQNIDQIQIPYMGRKIKVAGDRTYADWRVTIMNDEDFGVRSMFEKWSNALNRAVSNTRMAMGSGSAEAYKADMTVLQFSKEGEIIRGYQLVGAWPQLVESMELDWDSTNQIQNFNVTLAYDYWIPTVENSSKIAGGINQFAGNI
jgi:hypothetical protein